MLRVEPYSLRRTRDGDVVLCACEPDTFEYVTYRIRGISEVKVTGQTFIRKYANELLPPSHHG